MNDEKLNLAPTPISGWGQAPIGFSRPEPKAVEGDEFELPAQACDRSGEGACEACQ